MRYYFLGVVLFFFSLITIPLAAAEIPVKITADNMRYSQTSNDVIFSGNVHVVREDVQLWSKKLTVILEENSSKKQKTVGELEKKQGSIKRIIAEDKVRITAANNRSGTCGRAIYEASTEVLTLEKSPQLREGRNTIQGAVIKLYTKENRSEVLGGKQRVEAIFITPEGKSGGKL